MVVRIYRMMHRLNEHERPLQYFPSVANSATFALYLPAHVMETFPDLAAGFGADRKSHRQRLRVDLAAKGYHVRRISRRNTGHDAHSAIIADCRSLYMRVSGRVAHLRRPRHSWAIVPTFDGWVSTKGNLVLRAPAGERAREDLPKLPTKNRIGNATYL